MAGLQVFARISLIFVHDPIDVLLPTSEVGAVGAPDQMPPGMRFETLLSFVRKGRVRARSVVRGPTTHQLWRFAAHVKGLSREFGLCAKIVPPHIGQRYPSLPWWLARPSRRSGAMIVIASSKLYPFQGMNATRTLRPNASSPFSVLGPSAITSPL